MSDSHREAPTWRKAGAAVPLREGTGALRVPAADQSSPPTQIAQDRDDYLGGATLDVGRKTSTHEHELFVSCNPAPALQQQFEHLRPVFIAVHDIGTSSSRKLLNSLASASGRVPQKLVIRRQGYGTALATVHFVELPSAKGTTLRMYSTDCETDASWRQSLAHMLLAFSRLGVIMVGDLGAADIESVVVRLRDSMARGPWLNDQLLLLPLGPPGGLVNHGMELARGSTVNVRTTPQVARAADAWGFISGAWNRLTDKNQGAGAPQALSKLVTAQAQATAGGPAARVGATVAGSGAGPGSGPGPGLQAAMPRALAARPKTTAAAPHDPGPARVPARTPPAAAEPPRPQPVAPARPLPDAAIASLSQPATADTLRRYVRQVSELAGVVGCAVFDATNGNRVAYAGSGPSAADLASSGAALIAAIVKAGSALDLGRGMPEAAITLDAHHLLLRSVPRHPGLALHVVLDKVKANLTLVRLQVLRLDGLFEEPA